MKKELATIKTAGDVAGTVGSIVSAYGKIKANRKKDATLLQEEARAELAYCRAQSIGAVARANLQEIEWASSYLETHHFSPGMEELAKMQVDTLAVALNNNLIEYAASRL